MERKGKFYSRLTIYEKKIMYDLAIGKRRKFLKKIGVVIQSFLDSLKILSVNKISLGIIRMHRETHWNFDSVRQ